jgi:toxin YoeB
MKRVFIFSDEAWEDDLSWQETDRAMVRRINQLIKVLRRSPYEGMGKPEPLKHQLAGWWAGRSDSAPRLIYRVTDRAIEIASLRCHH